MPGKTPEQVGGPRQYEEKGYAFYEQKYADGRIEIWRRPVKPPTGEQAEWESLPDETDEATAKAYVENKKTEPKPEDPNKAPETVKTDDGRILQWDSAKKAWTELAPAKPAAPEKPAIVAAAVQDKTSRYIVQQMPDDSVRQIPNPNYDPKAAERAEVGEKQALTAAEIKLKRDELDLAYVNGKLSREERDTEFDQWYKRRSVEHSEVQSALANRREDRLTATDERRAGTESARLTMDQQTTAMGVGQQRVKNYLDTMPYRAGPGFAQNFASSINANGLNFSGADFAVDIPDLDAMADAAYQQAVARFQGGDVAPPPAVPAMASAVPAAIPPNLPYVPPQRMPV